MDIPEAEQEYQLAHINESRVSQMIAADMICLILSVLSTTVRLLSKRIEHARLRADDLTILVGTALISGYIIGGLVQDFNTGFGKHDMALTDDQFVMSGKIIYVLGLFYSSGYYIVKLAILLLYHRVFTVSWFRKLNYVVIGWMICIMISMWLVSLLSCIPIAGFWDYSIDATCVDNAKFFWGQAAVNAATDFVILLMPVPVLWGLYLTRRQKVLLSILFGLGGATFIVSLVRIPLNLKINKYDINWSYVPVSIATDVEIALAVICANLPTYRPLGHAILNTSKPLSRFLGGKVEKKAAVDEAEAARRAAPDEKQDSAVTEGRVSSE